MGIFDRFRTGQRAQRPEDAPLEPQLSGYARSIGFGDGDGLATHWHIARQGGGWLLAEVRAEAPVVLPGMPAPQPVLRTRLVADRLSFAAAAQRLAAEERLAESSGLAAIPHETAAMLGPQHWQAMLAREGFGLSEETGLQRLTPTGSLPAPGTLVLADTAVRDRRGILAGSGIDPHRTAALRVMQRPDLAEAFDKDRDGFMALSRELRDTVYSTPLERDGPPKLLNYLHWSDRFNNRPDAEKLAGMGRAAWEALQFECRFDDPSDRGRRADTVLEILLRNGMPATAIAASAQDLLQQLCAHGAYGGTMALLLMSGTPLPQLDWPVALRAAVRAGEAPTVAALLLRREFTPKELAPAFDAALAARAPGLLHVLLRAGAGSDKPDLGKRLLLADEDAGMLRTAIAAGFALDERPARAPRFPDDSLKVGSALLDLALDKAKPAAACLLLHAGVPAGRDEKTRAARLTRAIDAGMDDVAAALVRHGIPADTALTVLEALPSAQRHLPQLLDAVLDRLPRGFDPARDEAPREDHYRELRRLLPLAAAAGPAQLDRAVARIGTLKEHGHHWLAGPVAEAMRDGDRVLLSNLLHTQRPDLQRALRDIYGERESWQARALLHADWADEVQRLVDLGIPLPEQQDLMRPTLVAAIEDGRFAVVEPLLAASFNRGLPETIFDRAGIHSVQPTGPIDLAAAELHDGRTALHAAVRRCNAPLVERLLAAGADPALRDRNGRTPRDLAEAQGLTEIAQRLAAAERQRAAAAAPQKQGHARKRTPHRHVPMPF